jgi:putative thiamine transport system permease protein
MASERLAPLSPAAVTVLPTAPRWRGPPVSPALRLAAAAALALLALLFALPLLAALPLALAEAASAAAWAELVADPQTAPALGLTLRTALASTALALALNLLLVTAWHGSRPWQRLAAALPPMLAVPHAAFAIGLAWLLAPAGWLARTLAPAFGWTDPPAWQSVNDPAGLALIAVLVFKELPFLLWSTAALLARPEVAANVRGELAVARTLGYRPAAWWWRVGWLLWLPRLAWPLLAVLAYALTVVDLALIIGPGSPPTLAVLAWQHLADADPLRNAQGAAAALLLAGVLAAALLTVLLAWPPLRRLWSRWAGCGRRPGPGAGRGRPAGITALAALAAVAGGAVMAIYAAVLLSLAVLALAGPWPFPARWPPSLSLLALGQVVQGGSAIAFTAALAVGVSLASVLLAVAWFESTPAAWDRRVAPLVLAPLVLPQLLVLVGLYRGALALHLDGTVWGLAWVHLLFVLPYVFAALAPAWRSFDARYQWTAQTLGRSRAAFWWHVKAPLLAAPLASALAIGFAVSVAQYLATQFIGAGRHATLTTEAVTLASGGQRSLAAAFALLQALLPALAFGAAALVARRAPSPRSSSA